MNNKTQSHDLVYIVANEVNEKNVYYDITGLHPSLNYTFTAYINDSFNNTKDQDYVTFHK